LVTRAMMSFSDRIDPVAVYAMSAEPPSALL
jgi:hypothetical protein